MSELSAKAACYDRTIEAALKALENKDVKNGLGERAPKLAAMLDDIVPIISTKDAKNIERLLKPDTIPFAIVLPGESYDFEIGNVQMSTGQQQVAYETISSWESGTHTPQSIMDSIIKISIQQGQGPIRLENKNKSDASATGAALAVPSSRLRDAFDFRNLPANDELLRFTFRQLIQFGEPHGSNSVEPDVFFHELTHVKQKRDRPITSFSSQEQSDMVSLRDELEAYHVGSLVRCGIEGVSVFDNNASNKYIQIAIELIRLRHGNRKNESDPFEPSQTLLYAYEKAGYSRDRMLPSRFNFDEVAKFFGLSVVSRLSSEEIARALLKTNGSKKLGNVPSKNVASNDKPKANKRFTPPKKK